MKKLIFLVATLLVAAFLFSSFEKEKHCVYRTLMNEDPVERVPVFVDIEDVHTSVKSGLKWLQSAQQKDGGWGCGLHTRQGVKDPHAVETDLATTAMVAMSFLRSGSNLENGPYQKELLKATDYLTEKIKEANENNMVLNQQGTQIQRKLGNNIDIVMTTQFFTNLLRTLKPDNPQYQEIKTSLSICVDGIQTNIADNGSLKGGTWAGVLQSSFATSALESAQEVGIYVDGEKLKASQTYQMSNYNPTTEEAETADGAGVMLYAVSGSTRASAKEAKRARKIIEKAKKEGALESNDLVNTKNLINAGMSEKDAMELNTAYQVYQSGNKKSRKADVVRGYGNNGGEEFLSFLQTGESMIVNEDNDWNNWYDNITKTIMEIQNNDGSWNGHHCITSPVFCTATCVSLLTINNDREALQNQN